MGGAMAASGGLHENPRLGVLDGLRGLAVLLVLWYHVWEISWLSPPKPLAFLPATGFIGVTLFFFLSGFVISYPFFRADAARDAAAVVGPFRLAPLHQDRAVLRPLDRGRICAGLRATATQRRAPAGPCHPPALHSYVVSRPVRQHQRRAVDARRGGRVLLRLPVDLVGVSAPALALRGRR